jgi:Protein of unknown function (DUF2905)
VQRTLIIVGIVLLVAGLAWPWLARLPLGRLPGDVVMARGNFKLFVPITTMLVISALLSLALWLFRK